MRRTQSREHQFQASWYDISGFSILGVAFTVEELKWSEKLWDMNFVGRTQAVAKPCLAAHEIVGYLMQVITELRREIVADCADLLNDGIIEQKATVKVLPECRLGGIHGLGFQ